MKDPFLPSGLEMYLKEMERWEQIMRPAREFQRIHEQLNPTHHLADVMQPLTSATDSALAMHAENKIFSDLAAQAASAVSPIEALYRENQWSDRLGIQFAATLNEIPSLERTIDTARNLANLSRFSDELRYYEPFSDAAVDSIARRMGRQLPYREDGISDEEAIEHGVDPSLIDFSTEDYPTILSFAGLAISLPKLETPQPIGNKTPASVAFSDEAEQLLKHLERYLRNFIEKQMSEQFGLNWIETKVPKELWENWERKARVERESRELNFSLINYSDFTDLRQIIEKKENWRVVFKSTFGQPSFIQQAFIRLAPYRNSAWHHRPFTKTELLIIQSWSIEIFRAIGADINELN